MIGKRKKIKALIAQSLYEELSVADRRALEVALNEDESLCREAEALQALKDAIPVEPVQFEGDLRPAVMDAIHRPDGRSRRAFHIPHAVLVAAAFVLVAGGVIYWIAAHPPAAVAPGLAQQDGGETPEPALAAAMDRADRLAGDREYARAYAVLAEAVARSPRDERAAAAYQRMADLAFEELQWYAEAFDGYDTLRRRYAARFRNEPENFLRLNVLDETRGPAGDYAALRELDAAVREGTFGALESVVARHPATYVGSMAADRLAQHVAEEQGFAPEGEQKLRAMRMAQRQSRNPVVKTQLKLESAHLMQTQLGNDSGARKIYEEVANGSITVLAKLAEKRLAELESKESAPRPDVN